MVNMVVNKETNTFMRNISAGLFCYLIIGLLAYSLYVLGYYFGTLKDGILYSIGNETSLSGEM
jgi:hypothetical protein